MDPQAGLSFLYEYWALVEKARQQRALSGERKATMKLVNERLRGVNAILASLGPDVAQISARTVTQHWDARHRVARAMDLLASHQKVADHEKLGGGPALPLEALDPVVRQAAMHMWEAEKYRHAVAEAATSLSQFTQNRIGRHDIADKNLMAQAFSADAPEEGKPRLRCPGDHRNLAVRSMQQGALLMAQGAFQAIRNPAAHLTGDWSPVTAMEHLAVLSVVARWVRHWNVAVYAPPEPDLMQISAALQAQMAKPAPKLTDGDKASGPSAKTEVITPSQ